jgi:hypothetical protein
MKEDFLHYLWQYQKFQSTNLKTTDNKAVSVIKTGFHNTDSGPDFKEARLRIGEVEWAGNIEIHVNSSDWNLHKHQDDNAYENVVLHVVWEHDTEIFNKENIALPTLILKGLASVKLLSQYKILMESQDRIPCERTFQSVSDIKKIAMLERALTQRMERKGEEVLAMLGKLNGDWEEATFQILLRNFGFKLNIDAFLRLAENLPFKILKKYVGSTLQLEALLFGMAGFLEKELDEYGELLKTEFDFLSKKHELKANVLNASEWKFMRTRPANFPTIRLSQIAALMGQAKSLFSVLTEEQDFKQLTAFFEAKPSLYWQKQYHFGKKSANTFKGIGKSSIHNLIINTAVPVLVAYAKYIDNHIFMEKAMSFLEQIPAEKNRITQFWNTLDIETKTMYDSQGSIELYNEFCMKKKCLSCGVGIGVLG